MRRVAESPTRLPAAERRAQLLDVAREAFARDGYRGTSMDAIADQAGVTKPVLYQHFASKRALYLALLDGDLERLWTALEKAFGEAPDNHVRLQRGFGTYLAFADEREAAFHLLFTEELGVEPEFRRRVDKFRGDAADRIAQIIRAEAGVERAKAQALAVAITGMAESTAAWWLAEHRPLPASEVADELAGLAWKGFAHLPPTGPAHGPAGADATPRSPGQSSGTAAHDDPAS